MRLPLIPPPLLHQLKPGGRMVIAAGLADAQKLIVVVKDPAGSLSTKETLPVRFSELESDTLLTRAKRSPARPRYPRSPALT